MSVQKSNVYLDIVRCLAFPLLVLFLSLLLGAIFDLISQLFKKHKLLRQR